MIRALRTAVVAIMVAGAAPLSLPAHADWWSQHVAPIGRSINKTFNSVVKNPIEAFPMCWGSPQDCRGKPGPVHAYVASAPNGVAVSYRVDCRDRDTGADRADTTVTVAAPTHDAAVAAILQKAQTSDLCQSNGDLSRVTVPGSGRFLN
jgi:hypothetical protein